MSEDAASALSIDGHYARILTEDEKRKLDRDTNVVSEFKQNKYELEARKNWDLFYKRNGVNFFKDRHWTYKEFEDELVSKNSGAEESKKILLEVGCGVGNFIFPLLSLNLNLFIYACDFSPRAVEFVQKNPLYDSKYCKAFECDLTKDDLSNYMEKDSLDIVSLIFVLSAIHPDKMSDAVCNIYKVMKKDGVIIFRDYGVYDQAMLRFAPGHKLSDNFYVRQDGTRAYYFSEEYVKNLFVNCGFEVLNNSYVKRSTINIKEGIDVPRIFIQSKFKKK